ncbi:MAG: RluA family pseudouridine synthase [Clostridia bacterium]|nr:RluA family pseudouridine synthase [Clostridia bacterium]
MTEIIVKNSQRERIDKYLLANTQIESRSQIKKMFDENKVLVNGENKKSGYIVNNNDVITFELPSKPLENVSAQEIPLDILYEDEDLICINKPQGMVVHPGAGNFDQTLVNALKFHTDKLSDIGGENRLGIVHRIDKNTSGLLVIAKNNLAHVELQRQIQTKECKRYYLALLYGTLKEKSGVIDKNLKRSSKNRTQIEICPKGEGREAITYYNVLQEFSGYSLVKFELKTGRTHQIRVHAKSLGHGVVGDDVYAPNIKNKFKTNGQLLHAYKIQFTHPRTQEKMEFEASIPDYFQEILDYLEKQY